MLVDCYFILHLLEESIKFIASEGSHYLLSEWLLAFELLISHPQHCPCSSLFLLEQLRKEGKLPPAGELATPLDHSTLFPEHESSNTTGSTPSEEATLKLSNGVSMPQLAFGLYKIPNDEEGVNIILNAVEAGYRHFDAATVATADSATIANVISVFQYLSERIPQFYPVLMLGVCI